MMEAINVYRIDVQIFVDGGVHIQTRMDGMDECKYRGKWMCG